jgi:hypothetical protein
MRLSHRIVSSCRIKVENFHVEYSECPFTDPIPVRNDILEVIQELLGYHPKPNNENSSSFSLTIKDKIQITRFQDCLEWPAITDTVKVQSILHSVFSILGFDY